MVILTDRWLDFSDLIVLGENAVRVGRYTLAHLGAPVRPICSPLRSVRHCLRGTAPARGWAQGESAVLRLAADNTGRQRYSRRGEYHTHATTGTTHPQAFDSLIPPTFLRDDWLKARAHTLLLLLLLLFRYFFGPGPRYSNFSDDIHSLTHACLSRTISRKPPRPAPTPTSRLARLH